jgi:PilZ domain
MPFQEEEATGAQLLQRERCARFATEAAERIRSDEKCLFSLLPHQELARLAGDWYEACAQAMLRGNYSAIDKWVRSQSCLAIAQGFTSEDLLQLLRICRQSAIDTESWNEDIFSAVDEVIQEVFGSIHPNTRWNTSVALGNDNGAANEVDTSVPSAEVQERTSERRRFGRNRLRFPIRVRGSVRQRQVEEFTETQSVSRGGLYFVAHEEYENQQVLKISFPYWNEPGGINLEYAANVVRLDRRPDSTWGVGVDFLESLGRKVD